MINVSEIVLRKDFKIYYLTSANQSSPGSMNGEFSWGWVKQYRHQSLHEKGWVGFLAQRGFSHLYFSDYR